MSFSSDQARWLARFSLIWICLSFQILNLFRTLCSWGSINYRPSAPLLYEVASHVQKLPFRPIFIWFRWRVCRFLCRPAYSFDGRVIWNMYKAVSTEVNSAYNKISQKSRCRINTTITQWSVFCLGRFCRARRPAPFWWRPALFKKLNRRPALLTIFFYYRTKCALFKWHPALLKTWAEHWWCVEIILQRSFQRDQHLFHVL